MFIRSCFRFGLCFPVHLCITHVIEVSGYDYALLCWESFYIRYASPPSAPYSMPIYSWVLPRRDDPLRVCYTPSRLAFVPYYMTTLEVSQ